MSANTPIRGPRWVTVAIAGGMTLVIAAAAAFGVLAARDARDREAYAPTAAATTKTTPSGATPTGTTTATFHPQSPSPSPTNTATPEPPSPTATPTALPPSATPTSSPTARPATASPRPPTSTPPPPTPTPPPAPTATADGSIALARQLEIGSVLSGGFLLRWSGTGRVTLESVRMQAILARGTVEVVMTVDLSSTGIEAPRSMFVTFWPATSAPRPEGCWREIRIIYRGVLVKSATIAPSCVLEQ